jgi:N-acetyl-gamma-glutamyl-phosphate reductase
MYSATIIGASGYSGQETLDRILRHPELELAALGSDTYAGQPASSLDPRLARASKPVPAFVTNADALASATDVTFLCQGHETAAAFKPPAKGIVVDLSGAHRSDDPAIYEQWYGFSHPRADELATWTYAVPELTPPDGRLIANPGCYAIATILALAPLAGAIETNSVVVDAKSGVSGAGRVPKDASHAGAVLDNFKPYRVGNHQHEPEIARALGFDICFVPHLLPIRRGIIATCYLVPRDGADLRGLLQAAYADAPAVDVLPEGVLPELSRVQQTDATELGVFEYQATDRVIVIAAIDNLGKGAAGSAIQNANIALGIEPTTGLRLSGVLV